MKSWLWPAAVTGGMAIALVAGSVVSAQGVPDEAARNSGTRISVVCPASLTETADTAISAAGIDQSVRTSDLSTPGSVTDWPGLASIKNPRQPVRVSANSSRLFGATTVSVASSGTARGLGVAQCLAPQTTHWFTGTDISAQSGSQFTLVNLDSTEAVVDLTALTADGSVEVQRSLSVAGNSSTTFPLSSLPKSTTPIAVEVTSSPGRVAAFLRQTNWSNKTPLGADWVPESAQPGTDLVLSGVPNGSGRRTLVVANPSNRTAGVDVQMLTVDGAVEIADAQRLEVPPGSTRSVELAPGLGGQAAAVRLTSTQAVTAGVLINNGLSSANSDTATAGAGTALASDAVWPMALGKGTSATLQLANAGDQEATLELFITANNAAAQTSQVKVAAGCLTQVKLPNADTVTIRIQTASPSVRGSVVATADLGKVKGIAVLDLTSQLASAGSSGIVFDPHLG